MTAVDPFEDSGLENGQEYFCQITASNAAGASKPSETLSATPIEILAAPTGVRIVSGNRKARLSWGAVKGATGYNIWRQMSFEPNWEQIVEGYPSAEFEDTGLINGETYFYAVEGRNPGGVGKRSAQIDAIPAPQPEPPEGLRSEAGLSSVKLTWDSAGPDTDYVVLRSESPTGPFSRVTVVRGGCDYTDRKLKNGVTHYYVVRAANSKGTSEDSTGVEATPKSEIGKLFSRLKKDGV